MNTTNIKNETAQERRLNHLSKLFINERAEIVDCSTELLSDPKRGSVWRSWAAEHLPLELYREFGLIDADPESKDWHNVVEHCMVVAAGALTLGKQLRQAGVAVDLNTLVRSAIIHDASKRRDIERKVSREDESTDTSFETTASRYGYSVEEIANAKNTGRLPDRYIKDPVERTRAIAEHSIEATIIGYVDARTRGLRLVGLAKALRESIAAKAKDEAFFINHWYPYYRTVEHYLKSLAPSFDPAMLNDQTVFETVQRMQADILVSRESLAVRRESFSKNNKYSSPKEQKHVSIV